MPFSWPTLDAPNAANFLDHFDSSLDTSKWTAVTSGTGAVTVTDSYLKCDAPANSAAFVYYNTKLDKTKSQLWLVCASHQIASAGPEGLMMLTVVNGASAPTADTTTNILAKTVIRRVLDASDTSIAEEHWNSGGTRNWWNPATPAWQTSAANSIPDARLDDYYIVGLELDGVNSRWRIFAVGQSFATAGTYEFDQGWRLFALTDWVTWANTRSNTDLWLVLGMPFTNQTAASETRYEWVRYAQCASGNTAIDAWITSKTSISAANHRLRHLYSYDGLTFVPEDRTTWALNLGGAGSPDETEIERPCAVWDGGGTDYIFYTGANGSSVRTVCLASASRARPQNGPWTKFASNPIVNVGGAGANDEQGARAGAVVLDLTETDSSKRWKMIYLGFKVSDGKSRLMYATAPYPTATWTKQGTIVDVGTGGSYDEGGCWDPVIVRYGDTWEVWYEAHTSADLISLRRATGTDLASLTKDTTDYTAAAPDAKQSLTANMSAAPGRTVTVGDTSNFVKDASVVLSQSNGGDDYGFSKIRKIASGTSIELYHGITGFTTTLPAKIWQRNGGRNRSPRNIVKVGSEWWFYVTLWDPWAFAADDATYGALVEEMYLFSHSAEAPSGATATIQHHPSPVAWRGFNNDERSHENMTLLNPPFAPNGMFVFDTFTSSTRTGTQDPYTFNHAGGVDVGGVIVAAAHGTSNTDHIVGITYGGVSLTRYQTNTDSTTEPGRSDLWFVGDKAAIPDGTQTVSVDLASATTDDIHFVCMTVVAPGDTEVIDTDGINDNAADPTVTMNKLGRLGMAFAVLYGGGAQAAGTIQTGCQRVATSDLGAFYSDVLREDSADTADQAIGFSTLATDDVAFSAIAVGPRVSLATNPRPLAHLRAR